MRKLLPLLALALPLSFSHTAPANAQVGFDFRFGTPGYYDRYDRYDGYYDYGYPSYGYYRNYDRPRYRISCNEARRMVRAQGYRNVSTVECSGATYTFRASFRGDSRRVYVNSRTGAVWRG